MTRVHKFRAYVEGYGMMQVSKMEEHADGVMHYFTKCSDNGMYDLDNPKNALIEFTGKHDMNGDEIYDGDFLKFEDPEYNCAAHKIPYLVKWNELHAEYESENSMNFMNPLVWDQMEIVGNCHENPELLEN